MGFFNFLENKKDEFDNTADEHKGSLSHELIAGAAAYEGIKAYNKHCEKNGKPNDHAKAMEWMAAAAAAAVDKLVETKGLDFIDKQKAKKQAQEHMLQHYEEQ